MAQVFEYLCCHQIRVKRQRRSLKVEVPHKEVIFLYRMLSDQEDHRRFVAPLSDLRLLAQTFRMMYKACDAFADVDIVILIMYT